MPVRARHPFAVPGVRACVYLLASALALPVSTALAQAPGPYAGIGLGRGSFDVNGDALEQNLLDFAAREGVSVAASASSEDQEATAFKIFFGYRFNPYVGAEGGIVDLGDYFVQASVLDTFGDTLSANEELGVGGLSLAGVGHLPINRRFSLYAKLGVFFWDLDITERVNVTGLGTVSTGVEGDDGTEIFYGAGFEYGINRQFALRMEWERYPDIGDPNFLGREDIDLVSLNGVFRW